MESKSFIKDANLLKEDHKTEDLLDFSDAIKFLSDKIDSIKKSSLLGLVGGFGKGKSTLLYNLSKTRNGEKWIEFDAWKFPERKDLWEGFVLEFARQIDKKTFEEARKIIDGKSKDDKKTLINTIASIPLPGFPAIKNLTHFFETSPARRVFEIQEILTGIVKDKVKENIFIVIEDIDRSGDAGIFFLETLKQFLKNLESDRKIIAIIPISDKSYYANKDSYLKCIDYIEFFSASKPKLDNFVEKIFNEGYAGDPIQKEQMISFFESLFSLAPEPTIRTLKLILRKADINFQNQQKDGLDPDWRLSIIFEASRYFDSSESETFYENFRKTSSVPNHNLFASILFIIMNNSKNLYDFKHNMIQSPKKFKLVDKKGEDGRQNFKSTPWQIDPVYRFPGDDDVYFNCDFYLNY